LEVRIENIDLCIAAWPESVWFFFCDGREYGRGGEQERIGCQTRPNFRTDIVLILGVSILIHISNVTWRYKIHQRLVLKHQTFGVSLRGGGIDDTSETSGMDLNIRIVCAVLLYRPPFRIHTNHARIGLWKVLAQTLGGQQHGNF